MAYNCLNKTESVQNLVYHCLAKMQAERFCDLDERCSTDKSSKIYQKQEENNLINWVFEN